MPSILSTRKEFLDHQQEKQLLHTLAYFKSMRTVALTLLLTVDYQAYSDSRKAFN
jgi:hypothetical protein